MSTYSYPLFCPSPTAPLLAKRHTPSIYNAKCCVTNPQQPLFSWLKRSFQLEGFKAFGKLFIIVACDCRYRGETEQVLIRVLIHPYSRGDEVPCTLFTYCRGGREESYNQIKTYWDILHRRILDSMSVILQQLASLPLIEGASGPIYILELGREENQFAWCIHVAGFYSWWILAQFIFSRF